MGQSGEDARGAMPQPGAMPEADPWEAAYLRFETPEQEIQKFMKRLRKLGADEWPRDSEIVELFCGRGNGLHALERLGFRRLEGADLSPRLLAQYPEEMTVILQHQFWDLTVSEDRFEVGLSFGGIPERLVVPFTAIKSFFDPSVQFGLQFEPSDAAAEAPAASLPAVAAPSSTAAALTVPAPTPENKDEPTKPGEGAEVVRLDRFRKK